MSPDPDGVVTHADVYAWPQNLLTIADSQAFDNAGGIWLATPPQEGDVTFVQGGAAQPTSPPDARATGQHLQTRETDAGLVVYGHDLGHDWEIHLDNGVTRFLVDGVEDPGGSFSFAPGASIAVDVEGGTFLIGIYPGALRPGRSPSTAPTHADSSRGDRRPRRRMMVSRPTSGLSPCRDRVPGSLRASPRCRRSIRGPRRCIRTDCSAPAAMLWSRGASRTTPTSARW